MKKCSFIVIFLLFIPTAFSITLQDLINFFNFNFFTNAINVTNQKDFMIGKNSNGIDDTLIIELTTNGNAGNYFFIIDLYDNNNIITNETSKTLSNSLNKINVSFNAELLSGNKFNYSIKIYDDNFNLKYRKDSIETNVYLNYEKGIYIINISDKPIGDLSMLINLTLNITTNAAYEIFSYLKFNETIIFSKLNKTLSRGIQNAEIYFDNETIKNTHYIGSFNLTSIKINNKLIKTDYITSNYNYKNFAQTSYFFNFSDYGMDTNNNGFFDYLKLNAGIKVKNAGVFKIELALNDLFDNFLLKENITRFFEAGTNYLAVEVNGTNIRAKKFDGPYAISYIRLLEGNKIIDQLNGFYTTSAYNYTNFEMPSLPDLMLNIAGNADDYNNTFFNVSIKNIGFANAFNIFLSVFDNSTFSANKSKNILFKNEEIVYGFSLSNTSDTMIKAIVDFDNFVEEINESNNIFEKIINKKFNAEADNISITPIISVIGDANSINTSTLNLSTVIGNSTNFSQIFNGINEINFKDNNITIVEFFFNFSNSSLNLSRITIEKQKDNKTGTLLIRGIKMPAGFAKTAYIDKLNISQNGICIKDEEIISINDISENCSSANEYKTECDGTLQNGYTCDYLNSTAKYKITGLKFSGIKQFDYKNPSGVITPIPASGSSSRGSSSSKCIEDWLCSEWSECADSVQTRDCIDSNSCRTYINAPTQSQSCVITEITEKSTNESSIKMEKDSIMKEPTDKIKEKISLSKITAATIKDIKNPKQAIGNLIILFEIIFGLSLYFYCRKTLRMFK